MYLTKEQIQSYIDILGQPKASVFLNAFFNSYKHLLTSKSVVDLYDDEYIRIIENMPTNMVVNNHYKIHVYNQYAYNYVVRKVNKKTKVLEIGCGNGDFSLAVASNNVEYVLGLDFSEKAIAIANEKKMKNHVNNCNFICEDVTNFKNDQLYNYVILNDVIEHLSDIELAKLFIVIYDVLSDDGEIIIHTPNGLALCNLTDSNLIQKMFILYLRLFKGWAGHERSAVQLYYDQMHINIKSFSQVKRFLKGIGFSSKAIYDDKFYFPFHFLSSNMLVVAKKAGGKR